MPLLTIFSAPKPFTDPHIETIQRNAILSWMNLGPEVDVLLVGDEDGIQELAAEYNVRVLPDVECNPQGTPLVSSIFARAREASESPLLAYVNADILLMTDLVHAVKGISTYLESGREQMGNFGLEGSSSPPPFLLIGQRWDLATDRMLDFSPGWEARLKDKALTQGSLHRPAGSDYFIFPRTAFTNMPDFAIGRAGWDNWVIYNARQKGWPVIDCTKSITIVHQNHDYSHLPEGKPHYDLEESQHNMSLAGGPKHMYMVLDADLQFVEGQLRPPSMSLVRFVRRIEMQLMPEDGNLRSNRGKIARRFRRIRRRLR